MTTQSRVNKLQRVLSSDLLNPGMWIFAVLCMVVLPLVMLRNIVFGKPDDSAYNYYADCKWDEDEDFVG